MQGAAKADAPHCIAQASNTRGCGQDSVRHRGKGAGRVRKSKEERCPRPYTSMLLLERAAVISEGKRGLQSMYVGCQL